MKKKWKKIIIVTTAAILFILAVVLFSAVRSCGDQSEKEAEESIASGSEKIPDRSDSVQSGETADDGSVGSDEETQEYDNDEKSDSNKMENSTNVDENGGEAGKSGATEREKGSSASFRIELKSGVLLIENVFQYSGLNPDGNNREGEDIAAIQLHNESEYDLISANITAKTQSGSQFSFLVENIPPGKTVYAFDRDNNTYDMEDSFESVSADAQYSAVSSLVDSQVSVQTDGTSITIVNGSSETLENLTVVYHCASGEILFGGVSYKKIIDRLDAGQSVIIDASECYLGEAFVVSVKGG